MDDVKGLNPDTAITRSLRRYRERGISHGIDHGNNLTDSVVSRRNGFYNVIGVRDDMDSVHVVEHYLLGLEQDSHGSYGWGPIHVRANPLERSITR